MLHFEPIIKSASDGHKWFTLWMSVMSRSPCSIFGAIRTGSYMTYILMTKGLKQSVCDQSFYNGPVSKFWAYAFVLSKAPELGKSKPLNAISHIYVLIKVKVSDNRSF